MCYYVEVMVQLVDSMLSFITNRVHLNTNKHITKNDKFYNLFTTI